MKARTPDDAAATPARAENAAEPQPRGQPLYLQVSQTLRREIVEGIYPLGSQLPTEDVLRERFGVSRFTVREAIRRLREDGLVTSRQGAGTVVVPVSGAETKVLHATSISDLVTFATDTRFLVGAVSLARMESRLADRLGVSRDEEWLAARGLRVTIGAAEPVCRIEYYINRDYAAVGRLLPRHNGAIFTLIEDMFAVSIMEVNQEITATLMDAELAAQLLEPEGSPALEVRRTYRVDDDKIAQITVNTHPASRFSHMMTMKRVKT